MGAALAAPLTCGALFENALCLRNGEHLVLPPARPFGVVGHYTFDENTAIDSSGLMRHGHGTYLAGPPRHSAAGSSAFFRRNYITFPSLKETLDGVNMLGGGGNHMSTLNSSAGDLSWLVDLFVLDDALTDTAPSLKPEKWCPLIGQAGSTNGYPDFAPALYVEPGSGALKISVTTSRHTGSTSEFAVSNARLSKHTWYRIAVVQADKRISIYVNGVLDFSLQLVGQPIHGGTLPLYVGGFPEGESLGDVNCDNPVLVDNLSLYNLALGTSFIQADADGRSTSLFGSSEIQLSCLGCTRMEAEEGCQDKFHLCSLTELQSGVWAFAKSLGWLSYTDLHIWAGKELQSIIIDSAVSQSYGSQEESASDFGGAAVKANAATRGVGVCCADLSQLL